MWELTHSAFFLGLIGFFEFAPRLIQALTIICMLVTLFRMRPPTSPVSAAKGKWLKDIVEGVSYLRQNRRVFATILTTYSNGFFGIPYAQFLPYFAQEVLRVGPAGYGLLVSTTY